MDELIREKDHLAADNDRKQQLIKSLHQELAGDEAELDDDDDDPLLHRLRRECERHIKDCNFFETTSIHQANESPLGHLHLIS